MRGLDIDYFKQILLKEREKQYERIERFDEINKIDYNNGKELSMFDNHPAEIASETYEISKNMALKQQQVGQLQDIDDALRNIESGTYGICQACGQSISLDRLKIIPTAKMCITCQDKNETDLEDMPNREVRPVEEQSLFPAFARTDLDDSDTGAYDGEDVWQDLAQYNKTQNMALDWYDNNFYDADEAESKNKIDDITNRQYIDQLPDS